MTLQDYHITIVKGFADGKTVEDISAGVHRSVPSVRHDVYILRLEYNCYTIAQLVATFFRNKLIE